MEAIPSNCLAADISDTQTSFQPVDAEIEFNIFHSDSIERLSSVLLKNRTLSNDFFPLLLSSPLSTSSSTLLKKASLGTDNLNNYKTI